MMDTFEIEASQDRVRTGRTLQRHRSARGLVVPVDLDRWIVAGRKPYHGARRDGLDGSFDRAPRRRCTSGLVRIAIVATRTWSDVEDRRARSPRPRFGS